MPLGSRKAGSHLVKINFTSIRFGSVSHFNEQVDAVEGDGLEESEREGDREPWEKERRRRERIRCMCIHICHIGEEVAQRQISLFRSF